MNAHSYHQRVQGFLNINKPAGITSRTVVNQILRILKQDHAAKQDYALKVLKPPKVGHAGTLDPMATGVLVVAVGAATRLISHVQDGTKKYRGRFILGQTSDTDDSTGTVVEHVINSEIEADELERVAAGFVGSIEQVPPQYSAVHVGGQRAYALARQGKQVDIKPRIVEVNNIRVTDFSFPEFELAIECGSGTYIRSIGRDIGQRLGCGALMSQLERTSVGSFTIENGLTLDEISSETIADQLQPLSRALERLPCYCCSEDDLQDIGCGRRFPVMTEQNFTDRETVAIVTANNELTCLAEFIAKENRFAPRQVFL